jgi:hypothetical protein
VKTRKLSGAVPQSFGRQGLARWLVSEQILNRISFSADDERSRRHVVPSAQDFKDAIRFYLGDLDNDERFIL